LSRPVCTPERRYRRQNPAGSQAVPAGQHARHAEPAHAVYPAGQSETTSHVSATTYEGLALPWQTAAPSGQQVVGAKLPLKAPHLQAPSTQVSFTGQRLPHAPQLVGSVAVSTQLPAHTTVGHAVVVVVVVGAGVVVVGAQPNAGLSTETGP
jgi:hypothetical protein